MLLFDYFKYNVVYKNCKIKYFEYNKNIVRTHEYRAEENEVKTDEF